MFISLRQSSGVHPKNGLTLSGIQEMTIDKFFARPTHELGVAMSGQAKALV
jgi:hypothetical protein